jgi:hypothetical protein
VTGDAARITSRSEGTFNADEWFKEGDGLLVSARTTRATWLLKKRRFIAAIGLNSRPKHHARAWNELTGLPRASVLLLGYSIEMFLKAGLARAYHGCREEMFERDARKRFGHNLAALAREADFPLDEQSQGDLDTLKQHVLAGARYPTAPLPDQSYVDAVNAMTMSIWDRETFRRYCSLATAISRHVAKVDMDSNNPALFRSMNIDHDGYLMFRIGGNLRTRITYRPSTPMLTSGKTSPNDVRALLIPERNAVLLHYWDSALIVEDGRGGGANATVVRQDA